LGIPFSRQPGRAQSPALNHFGLDDENLERLLDLRGDLPIRLFVRQPRSNARGGTGEREIWGEATVRRNRRPEEATRWVDRRCARASARRERDEAAPTARPVVRNSQMRESALRSRRDKSLQMFCKTMTYA